ncbi:Altered inheritance of mitochondria protein 18 mitochondrial [Didymella heteroderae]|uniref:Altered inheritance of mitochondria protein 18 mitochondrial n=1 Tax=Didymella heteroderae TaxID=1769908 RepID=A0A9P5C227_9PLEO|nr:Altered inheritance of mitochondria protein 18 mitochondrial [Didymella heteroderae]
MMSARLAARRPIFQCLHAPTRSRNASHQARNDVDALLRQAQGRPLPGRGLRPELDTVSTHRANAMEIARLKKRRNWLALGAALSMIAPIFLVKLWDLPDLDKDNKDMADADKQSRGIVDMVIGPPTKTDSPRKAADEFQGKKVVIAAGDKVIAAPADVENPQASDPDAIELVETGTSYVPYFPRIISLPNTSSVGPEGFSSESEYQLLGLGIRKVSFLRVQVYVVGLYVKTADLSTLQNHLINTVNPTASALIPGEKEDLRKALLDPERSTQIWEAILSRDGIGAVDMAFRVVPCRGTDFKHLQDGWMRGIASRTDEVRRKQAELLRQQALESKTVALPRPVDEGEFADESFGLAMKEFKGIFTGKGKAPKGSVIVLTRDKKGALGAMYQTVVQKDGKEAMGKPAFLGEVVDPRVSRLVWLLYLGGQNVSSEDARKNIVDGCIAITERPVGTVEGMVQ